MVHIYFSRCDSFLGTPHRSSRTFATILEFGLGNRTFKIEEFSWSPGLLLAALAVVALFFNLKSKEFVSPEDAALQELTAASSNQPILLIERGFSSGVAVRVHVDGINPVERARNFLDTYRDLYFLNDEELSFAPSHVEEHGGGQSVTLSQTFTMGLTLYGLGDGLSAWVSSPTNPYLTMPSMNDGQAHLFNPRAGEQYFLNFGFSEDTPTGVSRIVSLQTQCGPYNSFRAPQPTIPVAAATPTPEAGGLALPYLSLLQNGNCRMNPGTAFDPLDSRPQGFQTSINGRTPDSAWLRVYVPEWNANCWFAASIVTVQGSLDGITIFLYPPAPTFRPEPTQSFTPQCSDGLDNDGDGNVDNVDRECSSSSDNDEAN